MKRIYSYKGFLNEGMNDMSFKTVIDQRDVDISNAPVEGEQYINAGDMTVEWELDIDARDYGIKSLGVAVRKVYGVYNLVTPTEDKDEEQEVEFASDKDWELNSEYESEFSMGSMFSPNAVEIDFKTKKITVKW